MEIKLIVNYWIWKILLAEVKTVNIDSTKKLKSNKKQKNEDKRMRFCLRSA